MSDFIKYYPDGTSYADLCPKKSMYTSKFVQREFIFRINDYKALWSLNQITDAFKNLKIKPVITIPWLLDGQADRRFDVCQSHNIKLICELLKNMEADFKIFHPHNPEVVEALLPTAVILTNEMFILDVLNIIGNDTVLMTSDAGGYKSIMKIVHNIKGIKDVVSASKSRKYTDDNESILTQSLPNYSFVGKDVLIVDDICVYGGTFIGLAKLLRNSGVNNIYLAVSHMTVSNPNPELFEVFDKVFITDSLDLHYNTYDNTKKSNLTKLNYFK